MHVWMHNSCWSMTPFKSTPFLVTRQQPLVRWHCVFIKLTTFTQSFVPVGSWQAAWREFPGDLQADQTASSISSQGLLAEEGARGSGTELRAREKQPPKHSRQSWLSYDNSPQRYRRSLQVLESPMWAAETHHSFCFTCVQFRFWTGIGPVCDIDLYLTPTFHSVQLD